MNSDMRKTLKVLYPDDFSKGSKKRRGRKTGFFKRQVNAFKAFLDDIGRAKLLTGVLTVTSMALMAYVAYAYNQFSTLELSIMNAEGNIQKEIQRRNDLINNLIPPTMKYLEYEQDMFSHVAKLRQELMGKVAAGGLQGELPLGEGIAQKVPAIMGVFENYPDLKASKPFTELMAELISTENRVAEKREAYNESVRRYNTYITMVPAHWVALMMRYEEKAWFEVEEEAQPVPDMLKQLTALGIKTKS